MSCTVGCPYEGEIAPERVELPGRLMKGIGVQHVGVADTIGVGTPRKVQRAMEAALRTTHGRVSRPFPRHLRPGAGQHAGRAGDGRVALRHLVAGLGGCPYAKGATGNVATEDVVYMLHGMGIDTGIDLDKLIDAGSTSASTWAASPTRARPGHLYAGAPWRLARRRAAAGRPRRAGGAGQRGRPREWWWPRPAR
jgi:hydroxymethylglutaryl-CoA lyase